MKIFLYDSFVSGEEDSLRFSSLFDSPWGTPLLVESGKYEGSYYLTYSDEVIHLCEYGEVVEESPEVLGLD